MKKYKQRISKLLRRMNLYDWEGNISTVIAMLKEIESLAILKENFETVEISFDEEWNYDEKIHIVNIYGKRMETNEEYRERIKKEKEFDKNKEYRERQEYLRLKQKFEGRL